MAWKTNYPEPIVAFSGDDITGWRKGCRDAAADGDLSTLGKDARGRMGVPGDGRPVRFWLETEAKSEVDLAFAFISNPVDYEGVAETYRMSDSRHVVIVYAMDVYPEIRARLRFLEKNARKVALIVGSFDEVKKQFDEALSECVAEMMRNDDVHDEGAICELAD